MRFVNPRSCFYKKQRNALVHDDTSFFGRVVSQAHESESRLYFVTRLFPDGFALTKGYSIRDFSFLTILRW